MNLKDITTQLLYTTVPLTAEYANGSIGSATGFIYNFAVESSPGRFIPFLVTNYHVLNSSKRLVIEFAERTPDGDGPFRGHSIRAEYVGGVPTPGLDPVHDIAAFPIGPTLNQLQSSGKSLFFRSIGAEILPSESVIQDLAAVEDIYFIGYPSGISDQHNKTPIVRRGISATPIWNDFQGKPQFLVDAGVYPGSSGSPVFLLNQGAYATGSGLAVGSRLYFLGILSESLVRRENPNTQVFLGLGVVTKAAIISSFLGSLAATFPKE